MCLHLPVCVLDPFAIAHSVDYTATMPWHMLLNRSKCATYNMYLVFCLNYARVTSKMDWEKKKQLNVCKPNSHCLFLP